MHKMWKLTKKLKFLLIRFLCFVYDMFKSTCIQFCVPFTIFQKTSTIMLSVTITLFALIRLITDTFETIVDLLLASSLVVVALYSTATTKMKFTSVAANHCLLIEFSIADTICDEQST